jgi:uroporphyrinogen III methyltransferase/synthase
MQNNKGMVFLVGAGPGDPGLLTIKGKELIEKADVIIYDRLANPRILSHADSRAELIYVGKQSGFHALSQDKINELIVKRASKGKTVVRLKGGDPFIFGRGGEEAEECVKNNIFFEIIPGVTSAISVPAYSGIPLTHRQYSASLTIVTGHRQDDMDVQVNWEGLAKFSGTIVFLMGMSNLDYITSNLIKYGVKEDMPAAVIQWGTTHLHRTVKGTLSNIVEIVRDAGIKPPSIIVVGDVVNLRDTLKWYENRPLLGKKIVVTRTREQASELIKLLEDKGACCIELPTIALKLPDDTAELDSAIMNLSNYDWVVFSSPNAVKFFMERLFQLGMDVRALGNTKIASMGAGSSDILRQYSLNHDLIPHYSQAEGMLEALLQTYIKKQNILIPRAKKARDILPDGLRIAGANVDVATCYENFSPEISQDKIDLLMDEHIDFLTFTSSSTVKNFYKSLPAELLKKLLKEARIACIGPVTAETACELGINVDVMPEDASIAAMVDEIEGFYILPG